MRTSLTRRILSAIFDAAGSTLAEDDPPSGSGFLFVVATGAAVVGGVALKEVRDLARRVAFWGDVNAALIGHRKDLNKHGQDIARLAAQIEKLAACIVPNPLHAPETRSRVGKIGLWRNAGIKGGKYLVVRRDGTVPDWPYFVIGARDPFAPYALFAYAREAQHSGNALFARDVHALAEEFDAYRKEHGTGDPTAPPEREDDPATIARMKHGT